MWILLSLGRYPYNNGRTFVMRKSSGRKTTGFRADESLATGYKSALSFQFLFDHSGQPKRTDGRYFHVQTFQGACRQSGAGKI